MGAQRDDLIRWLREVMRRNGWSAEHWAKQAGVSATSITRFIRDPASSWPSARTLAALAQLAGSMPPIGGAMPSVTRLPLIAAGELIQHDVMTSVKRKKWPQITMARQVTPGCVALVALDDKLEAAGILQGDTLVIDPQRIPQAGDLVLASTDQMLVGGAYQPPVLVERPLRSAEPTVWPLNLVRVRGVICHIMRDYPV